MAAKQNLAKKQIQERERNIVDGLKERGIRAEVELEKSGLPGKYRLYVISDDFEGLLEAERQSVIWKVLEETWPRADQLRLTLTLALTKAEAAGSWN